MTISEKDKFLLQQSVPKQPEINRILFDAPPVPEHPIDPSTPIPLKPLTVRDVQGPIKERVEETARMAINALSGAKKVIEAAFGETSKAFIREDEEEVHQAIEEVFGERRDVITFQMYKEALEKRDSLYQALRARYVNDQF